MKKKLSLLIFVLCAVLLLLPACDMEEKGSIKAITKPYIAEYECVEAKLGTEDLLKRYDYIYITLANATEMEVSFKPKNGKRSTFKGSYSVDPKTRELTGETGIWGLKFKESVTVKNGEFTIEKNICYQPLYMKFKVK